VNRRPGPLVTAVGRALDVLPTILALIAEGSWIAVVYALLRGASHEWIELGPVVLAGFAGAGLLIGRVLAPRLGGRWPAWAVVITVLAAAAGWLNAATTWSALLSPTPTAALGVNPGGWITGLAFLRGLGYARPSSPDGAVRSPMPVGLPAVVVSFLIGGLIAEPGRTVFRDAALVSTIVFVATATLALALTRASTLGRASGFDWRGNRTWFGLLLVFVTGILVVAVPASYAVGPAVMVVIAALPVPLFFLGLTVGLDRRLLRVLLVLLAVVAVLVVIVRLIGPHPGGPDAGGATGGAAGPTATPDWLTLVGGVFVLVLAAIAVGALAAIWMRQAPAPDDGAVAEERTIDHGVGSTSRTPRRFHLRLRRQREPTDASSAYLATLRELAADPPLERRADETPAEHARRLRSSGAGARFGAAVDLLAADYELVRFGASALTPGEHRRALGRWRRIRALVHRRPTAG
jgi:hypothetical protein